MPLPPNPNPLSDAALSSLLWGQARALSEQLQRDAADLAGADEPELARRVDQVIAPMQNLARAAQTNPKPEKRNA